MQTCEGTERSFSMAGTTALCLGAASFACPARALRALPRDLLLFDQNSFVFFFLSCCGFVNHPHLSMALSEAVPLIPPWLMGSDGDGATGLGQKGLILHT